MSSRRLMVLAILLVLANAAAYQVRRSQLGAALDSANDLPTIRLASGDETRLGQLTSGRPALLVFWTTWCQFCEAELQNGAGLVAGLAAGPAPVQVFFVNVREHRLSVEAFGAARAIRDHVLLDTAGVVADSLGVQAFPAFVVLDSSGKPVWRAHGLQEDLIGRVATTLVSAGETP